MNPLRSKIRFLATALVGAAVLLVSGASLADPPTRVARLSFFSGPVSFSPAGEDEWVPATPNRPLVTGDRLWADAGARAELQAGSVAIRLGEATSVDVLNLEDRTTQMELAQGSLSVRLWRLDRGETMEIDTPNLAFTISSVGRYRIDVDPDGSVTTLEVLTGQGEAYGEGAAYRIGAGERYAFSGTGLRDYEYSDIGPPDEFDRWSADRDRRYDSSVSARYVSRDVIGYQDLDQYGTWSVVASYGNVWYPRSIPSGWAPYRTGHWSWIDPWGWTWVDDAPWGFAPYHYGRWAYLTGRWGWIPGPVNVRPIYAPALVAFIGSGDLRLSLSVGGVSSGIAWFPLGPGEVYQPAYRVSRDYFTNVNISNTRITSVNITNVYNNYANNTAVTNVSYRNREAPGAVTAVPAAAFVRSQPVARAAVQLPREVLRQQPVSHIARVAPTRASLVAASAVAASAAKPPARALQRDIVARTRPPAPPAAFAARQAGLAAHPGRPLEPAGAAQQQPAPARATPPRNVKVVTPTQAAAPAPKGEGRRARGLAGERGRGAPAASPGASAGQQAGVPSEKGAPATGQASKGGVPTGGQPKESETARRARESGQRPADLNKGTAAPPRTGAGQATPVPRQPQERRTARPPPAPEPSGPTEGAKGALSPRGESVPPNAREKGPANERRRPPEGGPAAAPPAPPPQAAPEAQQRRQAPRREAPPQQPEAPRVAPPPPPPQAAPEAQQRRQAPRREAPPRRQEAPHAPPPPPPAAPRAAPPPPPPQPAAVPPRRPEPARQAPKGEPKRDEGKGKGNDKDQKDKDKKGSEG